MAGEKKEPVRCGWATSDPLYIRYHDSEWGVPLHNDRQLFELLILEGMQAGLSWSIVLKKRESFRKSFDNFDPLKISKYDKTKLRELLSDESIIRNKLKIRAAIQNAKAFLKVQAEFGNFNSYIWKFVGGVPKMNRWKNLNQIPSRTSDSERMSKDLLSRGFKFVGPAICYAFMQASGMVNDHLLTCFRRIEP